MVGTTSYFRSTLVIYCFNELKINLEEDFYMRRKLTVLSLLLLLFTLAFSLTACGGGTGGGNEHENGECKHQWQETIDYEATCEEKGAKTIYCDLCGESRKEGIDPLGHDIVVTHGKAATCKEAGLTDGEFCNRCNETIKEQYVIAALPHTPVTDAAVAETCTEAGLTAGSHCSVCETVITAQTVKNALGHSWEYPAGYAATCTEAGLTSGKKCSRCPFVEIEQTVIAAKEHTEVTDIGYAATCLTAGLTDGKHCTVCSTVTVAQEPIAATGHKIVTDGAIAPTCQLEGSSGGKYCETCKVTFESANTLEKVDHKFEGGTCVWCTLTHTAGLEYADVDSDSCEVTDIGSCDDEIIVIPEVHENKDVVGIADGAFEGTDIKEVVIIGELEYIGEDAFKDCTALKSVTLPKSVTEVKSGAFDGASSLEAINCEDFSQTEAWSADYLGSASAKIVSEKKDGLTPFEIYKLAIQNINSNLDKYIADDHRVLSMDEISPEVFEAAKEEYRRELQAQGGLSPAEIEQMVEEMYQQSFAAYTQLKAMADIVMDTRAEYTGDSFYIRNYLRYGYDGDETTNQYWYYDGCYWVNEPSANNRWVARIGTLALQDHYKRQTSGSAQELFTEKFFKAAEFSRNGSGYLLTVDVVGDALTEYLLMMSNDSMKDALEEMGFAYDDVTYYYYFDANGNIVRVFVDAGFSMGASEGYSGFTGSVVITQTFSNVGTLSEIVTKPIGNGFSSSEVPSVPSCNHPRQKTVKGFEATCTAPGLTDGVYCANCFANITLPEVIPAGHKLENGICTVCGINTTVSDGLAYEYNSDGKTATLIGLGACRDENIVIPTDVHGVVITKIAKDAFRDASFVKSVKIPASVAVIENGAFDGATALEKAYVPAILVKYLPKTVTEIVITDGETILTGSFENFKALTTLTLGSSVKTIEDGAFVGCDRLFIIYNYSSIYLSEGSDSNGGIAKYAMSIVTNKNQVSNVSVVGDFVFRKTNNYQGEKFYLTKYIGTSENVVLPEDFKGHEYTIDENAFKGVSTVKTIDAPAGVVSVHQNAFKDCTSTIIAVRGSVELIKCVPIANLQYVEVISGNMNAFSYFLSEAPELVEAKLDVDTVSSYAFANCPKLQKVTLGDNVETIGDYAFRNCESFKELHIGAGLSRIGSSLLSGVEGAGLYVESAATLCNISGYGSHWLAIDNLYVDGTLTRDLTVPSGVYAIANNAFKFCSAIDTIAFSNGLETVGEYAFSSSEIKRISFSQGLTSIGRYAFSETKNLEYVTLLTGLQTVSEYAFQNASALKEISLPEGLTSLGYRAFYGAKSLTSVRIPSTLESIPEKAFYNATSLKTLITVGKTENNATVGLKSIGKEAFSGCRELESVLLQNSVKTIGEKAFYGAESLVSLELGSVETIGNQAFYGCESLKVLNLPETLKTIGVGAFCEIGIVTITLPASLESIGENAFDKAYGLMEVIDNTSLDVTKSHASGVAEYAIIIKQGGESSIDYKGDYGFLTVADGDNAGVYLVDYVGTSRFLELPDDYNDAQYEVGKYFCYNSDIITLVISDGVTEINDMAFALCRELISVTVGKNVSEIDIQNTSGAFDACYKLIEIVNNSDTGNLSLPNALETHTGESKVDYVDGFAFYTMENGTTYLVSYVGEDSVITLPALYNDAPYHVYDEAFYYTDVEEIKIPETILSFGAAFFNSETVKTNVYEGVRYLGNDENPYVLALGFTDDAEMENITNLKLHSDTVMIAESAFYNEYYVETIDFGENLKVIFEEAFYYCEKLKEIILPDSVIKIGNYAFATCKNAERVYLGASLEYIGNNAFIGLGKITEITIPASVTHIGAKAFYNTYLLEKIYFNAKAVESFGADVFYNYYTNPDSKAAVTVVIGDGVTVIPDYAFGNSRAEAPKVVSVTVADPSDLKYIGAYAFGASLNVEVLELPSAEHIGIYAFYGSTSLKSIKIPNAKLIDSYAFASCSLLESVDVGSATINAYAFYECNALKTVKTGENAQVKSYAFKGCTSVTELALPLKNISVKYLFTGNDNGIPASLVKVTLLGDEVDSSALKGCANITSITIADTVAKIGGSAFYGTGISEIELPAGLKSIGEYAFAYCKNLTSLAIPAGTEEIGGGVVEGAEKLESLEMPFVAYKSDGTAMLKYFASSNSRRNGIIPTLKTLKLTNVSRLCEGMLDTTNSIETVIIEGDIKVISNRCFQNCASLKSVALPAEITEIGDYAFFDCQKLETLVIPTSLEKIGSFALYNLTSLKSLTIPETVKEFGACAIYFEDSLFASMDKSMFLKDEDGNGYYLGNETNPYMIFVKPIDKTKSVEIADTTKYILDYAFYGCTELDSIEIPASVEVIGTYAFYNTGLTELTIPGTVKAIGDSAFNNCDSLVTVTVGEGIKLIPECAFYDCAALKTVNLPVGLEKIDNDAFAYTSIETVNIPSIEAWLAIENNYSDIFSIYTDVKTELKINGETFTDLVVPAGVTEIKSGAFENYKLLKSASLGNDLVSVGSSAFASCSGLRLITVGEKLTHIGGSAFSNAKGAIFIPKNVTTVDYHAFYYFYGSIFIEIAKGNIPSTWNTNWADSTRQNNATYGADGVYLDENGVIYALLGDDSAAVISYIGESGEVVIPDKVCENYKVTKIVASIFSGNEVITSFQAGANLSRIPANAFQSCSNLKSVDLSACVNMTAIGDYAFESCKALEEVVLPVGMLDGVGMEAFSNCTKLATINIDAIRADIGKYAFYNCYALTSIKLSAHKIGERAFYSCSGVTTLDIGSNLEIISSEAFALCGITNLVIPDQVTTINYHAFFRCSNLVSITIGSGVKSITANAFSNYNQLESVTFKNLNGWYVNDNTSVSESLSETDLKANADFLMDNYDKKWNRNG